MIILWNVYSFHKKATLRIESSNAYNARASVCVF